MEDLLEEVRGGSREITEEMASVLFACHDFPEDCMQAAQNDSSDDHTDGYFMRTRNER